MPHTKEELYRYDCVILGRAVDTLLTADDLKLIRDYLSERGGSVVFARGRASEHEHPELDAVEPEAADTPFGQRSTAGKLFGATGGVMEAAVRTAYYLVTGREFPEAKIRPLRGLKGWKEFHTQVDGIAVGAAVVNGLGNARKVIERMKSGQANYHFIEVMTCPGGCIGGGGQPRLTTNAVREARIHAIYLEDEGKLLRKSHENPEVKQIYGEFLEKPLGKLSHKLLHTHYKGREF
jgi:NADH-quinone oxidoreductase subunit G/NADP-reducing hydrogenase subunit HndD